MWGLLTICFHCISCHLGSGDPVQIPQTESMMWRLRPKNPLKTFKPNYFHHISWHWTYMRVAYYLLLPLHLLPSGIWGSGADPSNWMNGVGGCCLKKTLKNIWDLGSGVLVQIPPHTEWMMWAAAAWKNLKSKWFTFTWSEVTEEGDRCPPVVTHTSKIHRH